MRDANRRATLGESLRSLAGTSIALLRIRIALFAVEFEQELWRFRSLLVWCVAVLLLAVLAITFLGVALIAAFWDSHRELTVALVGAGFLVLTLAAGGWLFYSAKARPRLFSSTLKELERDLEALERER